MPATWKLSSIKATVFEGFFEHELKENEWFLMDIPTPKGMVQHEVRFINSPMESYKPLGAGRWSYQANIELKKRNKISEEDTTAAALQPNTLEQLVDSLSDALNTYQENQ